VWKKPDDFEQEHRGRDECVRLRSA
jgi:hypothetical protein